MSVSIKVILLKNTPVGSIIISIDLLIIMYLKIFFLYFFTKRCDKWFDLRAKVVN